MTKIYRRYERLSGNRPGRNVCVSGRITDAQDDQIDILAEKDKTTRSKILSDALENYLKKHYRKDTTLFPHTQKENWDSTLTTILIEKSKEGGYIGIVPSLEDCYSYGATLKELFVNLREAIETNIHSL